MVQVSSNDYLFFGDKCSMLCFFLKRFVDIRRDDVWSQLFVNMLGREVLEDINMVYTFEDL